MPTTSADLTALTERARSILSGDRITLDVGWNVSNPSVQPLDIEGGMDAFLNKERKTLMQPLERRDSSDPTTRVMRTVRLGRPEDRSPDAFREEVNEYIATLREHTVRVAIAGAVARRSIALGLHVTNATDFNFENVEVTLTFEDAGIPIDEDKTWLVEARLPDRPRTWGSMRLPDALTQLQQPWSVVHGNVLPSMTRMAVDREDPPRVIFPPLHLRPRATEELPAFLVYATPDLAGKDVEIRWAATSTSADGVISGRLSFPCRRGSDAPAAAARLAQGC